MSYNRLIHDYLDGALDQTSEEALFAHLSGDSGLRSEFSLQVKFNNLVASDLSRITVPSEVTAAVFSKLGYAPAAALPLQNSSGVFLKRFSGFILLLLLLFTGISSIYLLNQNNVLKDLVSSKNSTKALPMTESYSNDVSALDDNLPMLSKNDLLSSSGSNSGSNSLSSKHQNLRNSGSNLYSSNSSGNNSIGQYNKSNYNSQSGVTNSQVNLLGNDIESNSSKQGWNVTISDIQNADFAKFSGEFGNNSTQSFVNNPISNQHYQSTLLQDLILPKWSFQLRHISNQGNYPAVSVSSDNNFLADNAIGIWYNYSPTFSFGVESGVEKFSQEFVYNNLNYSQVPMLHWVGLSVKYNEELIPYIINPYVIQSIAYTSIGMLSRTQGGLIFNVSNPVSFFVGMEWGVLLYNVSGNLYDSQKLGLTVGININIR